ncbi:hypothetical protein M422DRAFT_248154 [Sphaerobolus stellatus SS14]|uniref:Uncharacterized protein n=1 Tax=Sphaerobolus stellatus (strain SS14) TaxID=990650 RepID=A0A0C9W5Z5_SPHS4|nr:hypothetical protein M422DRAFT_248154 [Sphaerobolus stellatus SS14]
MSDIRLPGELWIYLTDNYLDQSDALTLSQSCNYIRRYTLAIAWREVLFEGSTYVTDSTFESCFLHLIYVRRRALFLANHPELRNFIKHVDLRNWSHAIIPLSVVDRLESFTSSSAVLPSVKEKLCRLFRSAHEATILLINTIPHLETITLSENNLSNPKETIKLPTIDRPYNELRFACTEIFAEIHPYSLCNVDIDGSTARQYFRMAFEHISMPLISVRLDWNTFTDILSSQWGTTSGFEDIECLWVFGIGNSSKEFRLDALKSIVCNASYLHSLAILPQDGVPFQLRPPKANMQRLKTVYGPISLLHDVGLDHRHITKYGTVESSWHSLVPFIPHVNPNYSEVMKRITKLDLSSMVKMKRIDLEEAAKLWPTVTDLTINRLSETYLPGVVSLFTQLNLRSLPSGA